MWKEPTSRLLTEYFYTHSFLPFFLFKYQLIRGGVRELHYRRGVSFRRIGLLESFLFHFIFVISFVIIWNKSFLYFVLIKWYFYLLLYSSFHLFSFCLFQFRLLSHDSVFWSLKNWVVTSPSSYPHTHATSSYDFIWPTVSIVGINSWMGISSR